MRKYNHLFECEIPNLGNENLYFKHPRENLWVSDQGIIYENTDKYFKWDNIFLKKRARIAYEAFHDKLLTKKTIVYFINGNIYDLRKENLITKLDTDTKQLHKERNQFMDNTAKEMIKRENKIPGGIEPMEYWKILGIEKGYVRIWFTIKSKGKVKYTYDEIQRIYTMRNITKINAESHL